MHAHAHTHRQTHTHSSIIELKINGLAVINCFFWEMTNKLSQPGQNTPYIFNAESYQLQILILMNKILVYVKQKQLCSDIDETCTLHNVIQ